MVHEAVPDRLVPIGLDSDLDLRPNTVGARDEERAPHPVGEPEHPAEPAERAARSGREGGLHQPFDAVLGVLRRGDVDAGGGVGEGVATHEPRA